MLEVLQNETFQKVLIYIVGINIFLSGVAAALDKIKDVTVTNIDNRIASVIHKIVSFMTTILDFLGGNRKHK